MGLMDKFRKKTKNAFGVKVVKDFDNDEFFGSTNFIESIYNMIANEFAKVDFYVYKKTVEDGTVKYDYDVDSGLNDVFGVRSNELLTPYDFKAVMAYQLMKYGNALAEVVRDRKGRIIKLIPYNLAEYTFGNGYELLNGKMVLHLQRRLNSENPLNTKKNDVEDIYIYYDDLIHLRLSSNNVFNGDLNNFLSSSLAVKVVDSQLNAILNDIADNRRLIGYVTQGRSLNTNVNPNDVLSAEEIKLKKQDELNRRFKEAKKVAVLDAGETFQEFRTNFSHISEGQFKEVKKILFDLQGINEDVLNGKATAQEMELFFSKCIRPIAIKMQEEVTYKCLTRTARTQGAVFDYTRNVYEYVDITKASDSAYKQADVMSKNTRRKMILDLPPIDDGEKIYDNLNFTQQESLKGGDE